MTPQSNENSLFWKFKDGELITYYECERKANVEGFEIIAFFGLYESGDIATAKHYIGGFVKDITNFESISKEEFDKAEEEYTQREQNENTQRRYLI